MVVFQVFWLGWDEVQLDQAVLKKTFYTITLKWLQWQSYNLYFAFEPSCRLEMSVTTCIVIDFQRAKNSKYTITQRTRPLMGAWEPFVSHTDALQSVSLNVSLGFNLWSCFITEMHRCAFLPFACSNWETSVNAILFCIVTLWIHMQWRLIALFSA